MGVGMTMCWSASWGAEDATSDRIRSQRGATFDEAVTRFGRGVRRYGRLRQQVVHLEDRPA